MAAHPVCYSRAVGCGTRSLAFEGSVRSVFKADVAGWCKAMSMRRSSWTQQRGQVGFASTSALHSAMMLNESFGGVVRGFAERRDRGKRAEPRTVTAVYAAIALNDRGPSVSARRHRDNHGRSATSRKNATTNAHAILMPIRWPTKHAILMLTRRCSSAARVRAASSELIKNVGDRIAVRLHRPRQSHAVSI